MGLRLVEDGHPGSSVFAVRFDGDIDDLNQTLLRNGLNIRVVPDSL